MLRMDVPVSKANDIQSKIIEGKVVLLNLDEAILLELNDIATKIWSSIDGKKTGQDIVDYLTENFEVERRHAEKDIYEFLKQLLRDGIITLGKKEE